jgi:hypothetical protein
VHLSCYSVPRDALSRDEWRCDPCDYYYGGGGAGRVCCYVCTGDEAVGVLKRTEADIWKHVNCADGSTANPLAPAVPEPEPAGARRRLRKMGDPSEPEPAAAPGKRPPRDGPSDESKRLRRPLGDVPLNDGSRLPAEPASESASTSRRKRRRRAAAASTIRRSSKAMRFLDLEAAIGSDDDVEGDGEEEDDLSAIESEEAFLSSFINDSSQLGGYSQEDDLDRADPDAHAGGAGAGAGGELPHSNDATLHRTMDMDRERRLAFATPALNRRQHLRNRLRSTRESLATLSSSATTATPASAPSSIKGLGNMHFVRSVLEHHRRGGDADDVEALYRNLERQGRRGGQEEDEDAGGSQEDSNANGIGGPGGVDDDDHHESDGDDHDADEAAFRRPVRPPPVLTVAVPYADSGGSSEDDDCSGGGDDET